MSRFFLHMFFAGVLIADSEIIVHPEDTTKCVTPKNLVVISSSGIPRTEFYSCTSRTVLPHLRGLDAIAEWGKDVNEKGATITGIAPTERDSKDFAKKYGKLFMGKDSARYKQYLTVYDRLVKQYEAARKAKNQGREGLKTQ